MKTATALIVVVALATNDADAFVMPTGSLVGGASSTAQGSHSVSSISSTTARAETHGARFPCISCTLAHDIPRAFLSRSSGVSRRSHGAGCHCRVCSMRMKAHPDGCDCGGCPTTAVAAFHRALRKCPEVCGAFSKTRVISWKCKCAACTSRPTLRRGASSLTRMDIGGGGEGSLKQRLADDPASVMFEDTMAAIAEGFHYVPKRFLNGVTSSDSGVNEGSCKVFSFGMIAGLSPEETLACFGEHYRSVLADPEGTSHNNIRSFMVNGWDGVDFPDGLSLSPK